MCYQSLVLKALRRILPLGVRRAAGDVFWWLWAQPADEIWQWRQNLEILEKGGELGPGIGLEEEKEYISKRITQYYGSFEGLNVLGAGCGTGRMEAWMASQGAKVICLDHLQEAIQISRIHAERIHCSEKFIVGDLERMPFKDKTFDLINSGGVLEHFATPQKALNEYYRVTKPNGIIIVSVPNLVGHNAGFGMKPLVELFYRKNAKDIHIEINFSGRRLKEFIQDSGFQCLDISPTLFNVVDYFPFIYLRKILSFLGIYNFLRRLSYSFGKKFPGVAFGYSFIIAFAKRPEN